MKSLFKKVVTAAITYEAKLVLKRYKPKIVGVTGSVGKTTTKDAVYTALASTFSVRKSEKSFNTEIGIPLTILGLPNGNSNPFVWIKNIIEGFLLAILPFKYPQWLVLEVGAEKPGDIEEITQWLHPDIVVITRFGEVPVHVEFFQSIEDLINEKGFLVRALKKGGILVLNHDDKHSLAFGDNMFDTKKMTYGFGAGATVEASNDAVMYAPYENSELEFPSGMTFRINYSGSSVPVSLEGGLGKQHIYPLLAATAVGLSQGINTITLSQAFDTHVLPKGRMRLIEGNKDTAIIDDTYNASPVAVHAALDLLKNLKVAGRKIAVLGDMLELGQYSIEEHRKVGVQAAAVAGILVTVGVRARGIADAALDAQMDEMNIFQFETSREAGKYLDTIISAGDIILVKGSQSMRMERVVEEIMRNPENKEKLLVRQDPHWKARV